ncbi:MAG: RNA polymerase sigma factor [Candidatus Krumholzibacteria bacterium]|nr:RNA polymerase sigma factor [Candidatus Krumholzibacteria bacterium]
MRGDKNSELVASALRENENAFRKLIEKYNPVVYSVVRGIMGNHADAEDTVQEIFIKVYRGLGAFRGDSRLSTWIYRIARNEAINASARIKSSFRPIEEANGLGSERPNPHECYEKKKTSEQLEMLLSKLDENYRVALKLRYMGERSYSEIAEIMDIPIGTVKTYIHRAKILLKKMLTAENSSKAKKGYGAQ